MKEYEVLSFGTIERKLTVDNIKVALNEYALLGYRVVSTSYSIYDVDSSKAQLIIILERDI